jgi:hypothetical protein
MRQSIQELQRNPEVSREELDKYISDFIEAELYKDDVNVYQPGREAATKTFSEQRGRLARDTLRGLNLTMIKLQDDRELSGKAPIDVRAYNDRTVDVVNGMTYIAACTQDVPRSHENITKRRNIVLWDALGIDRDRINQTMTSSENVDSSFDALREVVGETFDNARKEFPEMEKDYRVVGKILY